MIMNKPSTLTEAIEQNVVSWRDPIRRDFHVSVFKDAQDIFIFAPEYNTAGVIQDCMSDAAIFGATHGQYSIKTILENTQWPHVIVTLTQPKDNEQF